MELGAFSISLAVKDIAASRAFYEKFGFNVFAGDASQHWLIERTAYMQSASFKACLKRTFLTFNTGWDSNAKNLYTFTDLRDLQRELKAQGVQLTTAADEMSRGPASFTTMDPDGNPIPVDQHI